MDADRFWVKPACRWAGRRDRALTGFGQSRLDWADDVDAHRGVAPAERYGDRRVERLLESPECVSRSDYPDRPRRYLLNLFQFNRVRHIKVEL